VPIGYIWHREIGLGFDPDLRIQEVVRLIFARFRELGSARQVLLSMLAEQVHFPRPPMARWEVRSRGVEVDATSRLMQLRFVTSESAFDYFGTTRAYLEEHGKPVAFYSGAADAGRGDDADGPGTAHRRSSNRARSRATPNSLDALPASPPPSSGQSRNTAPARSIAPGCEPQRVAGGCWVCLGAWKAGSWHRPA
jgi:hypothetical protein